MSTTEPGASNEPQLIAGWLETSDGQYAGYYAHEPDGEPDDQALDVWETIDKLTAHRGDHPGEPVTLTFGELTGLLDFLAGKFG